VKSQSWLWSLIAVLVLAGGSYGVFVLLGEEPLPKVSSMEMATLKAGK